MSYEFEHCPKFGDARVDPSLSIDIEIEHITLMDADYYEIPHSHGKWSIPVHHPTHIPGKVVIVHKEGECSTADEEERETVE